MSEIKNEFGKRGGPLRENGACLLVAHELINGQRQVSYGDPEDTFVRVAELWSAYTGHDFSPEDVCICMALLKIGRQAFGHSYDNMVDAAGYIGLACDLAEMGDE